MLHMLGQRQLARCCSRSEACRRLRRERLRSGSGLPVASKPDSQELCFAPSGGPGNVRAKQAPVLVHAGGRVVDTDGTELAEHDGTFAFTVGQRRGLGVALGEPAYVVDIDARENRVVVGPQELLARRGLVADRLSWVAGDAPAPDLFEAQIQIRYRGDGVPAIVSPQGDRIIVTFETPQRAVAPGQSAVVYRDDELLGGGRIVESFR